MSYPAKPRTTTMDPSARGSSGFVLFPVDQEALHAIHSELEPGDSLDVVALSAPQLTL